MISPNLFDLLACLSSSPSSLVTRNLTAFPFVKEVGSHETVAQVRILVDMGLAM